MQSPVPSSSPRLLVLSDKRAPKEFQTPCHPLPHRYCEFESFDSHVLRSLENEVQDVSRGNLVIRVHVLADQEDVVKPLHEVTRTSLLHDCTLLCGWRYYS
jgi:hypothetical protein